MTIYQKHFPGKMTGKMTGKMIMCVRANDRRMTREGPGICPGSDLEDYQNMILSGEPLPDELVMCTELRKPYAIDSHQYGNGKVSQRDKLPT